MKDYILSRVRTLMNDFYKLKPICSFFTDKMCDQISDAVLDAHLKLDPDSKVRITAISNCKLMI